MVVPLLRVVVEEVEVANVDGALAWNCCCLVHSSGLKRRSDMAFSNSLRHWAFVEARGAKL